MHAIQGYHYKRLQQCLQLLRNESTQLNLPPAHIDLIIDEEKKLKELYDSYHEALQKVSDVISQYRQKTQAVQRLTILHKKQVGYSKINFLQSEKLKLILPDQS